MILLEPARAPSRFGVRTVCVPRVPSCRSLVEHAAQSRVRLVCIREKTSVCLIRNIRR